MFSSEFSLTIKKKFKKNSNSNCKTIFSTITTEQFWESTKRNMFIRMGSESEKKNLYLIISEQEKGL